VEQEAIGAIATGTALLIGLILRGQRQASQQTSELIKAIKIDSSGSSGSSGSSEASNQITVTGSANGPPSAQVSDIDRIMRAVNSSHEDIERRLSRIEQGQSDIYGKVTGLTKAIRDGISQTVDAISSLGTRLQEKISQSLGMNQENRETVQRIARKVGDTPVSKP